MKIRSGFVSNSSSSSFIISHTYKKEDILKYVKEQTLVGAVKSLLNDIEYELTGDCKKYGYEPGTIKERVEDCKKKLDRFLEYYKEEEYEQIRISTVKEMIRDNNEDSDFDIAEWYPDLSADDDDWVVYDMDDNFIPENACNKIIKRFKCIDYNTHMG